MNFSIITSFTIGGILLVSLVTLSSQVLVNSANSTLDLDAKNKIEATSYVITQDLMRIGYHSGANKVQDIFHTTTSTKIVFDGDVYNDGTAETVTWEFQSSNEYTASSNPNDYRLVRTGQVESGGGNVTLVYPVVHFELTYYDKDDNVLVNPSGLIQEKIRKIEVEIACESAERTMKAEESGTEYQRSYWKRKVIPSYLQIQ